MTSFRYPYHFVPVQTTEHTPFLQADEKCGNVEKGKKLTADNLGTANHDRYHRDTFSGSLICTLTTQGPVVFGGEQEKQKKGPTIIHPFEINGKPAIPGSTLRGCISSIAEAAGNSALRVLDNVTYSRRSLISRHKNEALSAVGLVVREDDELRLRPLALPSLTGQDDGTFSVPPQYRTMFPHREPRLRAYCYDRSNLSNTPPSYSNAQQKFWYAAVMGRYTYEDGIIRRVAAGKEKRAGKHTFLLGCQAGLPVNQQIKGQNRQRGILRVLYTKSRNEEIPGNKKHEFFLPYPEGIEKEPTYPILAEALERFSRLAKGRDRENKRRKNNEQQDMLPFALKGTEDFNQRNYTIKEGDIVFFEPNDTGEKVAKISISQIWREEITDTQGAPATTHGFFSLIDPEVLPMNPDRTRLTPAELLFGFVEELKDDENDKPAARALASRLRFSNALPINKPGSGYYTVDRNKEGILLRILATPKPPCPTLYFRKRKLSAPLHNDENFQCYIAKGRFTQGDKTNAEYIPQGRKQYLHNQQRSSSPPPYETRDKPESDEYKKTLHLKSRVWPLDRGCSFSFTIDFDNLTVRELGLLVYSLSPASGFRHKIGMGKPLGLGTVNMEVSGVELINRPERYSVNGVKAGRYHSQLSRKDNRPELEKWLEEIKKQFHNSLKVETQVSALTDIGCHDSGLTGYGPGNNEKKTFAWFADNDKGNTKQGLIPLDKYQPVHSTHCPLPLFKNNG